MPKNKQSDLIVSAKTPNRGFINKYKLRNKEGEGYSVLVNYQSLLSITFPLAPLPIIFLYEI